MPLFRLRSERRTLFDWPQLAQAGGRSLAELGNSVSVELVRESADETVLTSIDSMINASAASSAPIIHPSDGRSVLTVDYCV